MDNTGWFLSVLFIIAKTSNDLTINSLQFYNFAVQNISLKVCVIKVQFPQLEIENLLIDNYNNGF